MLAGDASYRRYSRLLAADGATVVLVRYPGERRQALKRDVEVARWLSEHGVRTAEVREVRPAAGEVVVEDLGEEDAETTLAAAGGQRRGHLAAALVAPLVALAAVPPHELPAWNAPLDCARLRAELAEFEEWFLGRRLGLPPDPAAAAWLDGLAAAAGGHPRRVCHRDYHLNNLFFLAGGEVAVIDAQDVLVGPDCYDAVSLVGERAFPEIFTHGEQQRWLERWAEATAPAPGWEARAVEVKVQRGLKVLGTFARLTRQGRSGYSAWIPALAGRTARAVEELGGPASLTAALIREGQRSGNSGGVPA